MGVLFVVAGLLGWARRPGSAVGRLLTIAGLAWLAARVMVGAGRNPLVFTITAGKAQPPSPSAC